MDWSMGWLFAVVLTGFFALYASLQSVLQYLKKLHEELVEIKELLARGQSQ